MESRSRMSFIADAVEAARRAASRAARQYGGGCGYSPSQYGGGYDDYDYDQEGGVKNFEKSRKIKTLRAKENPKLAKRIVNRQALYTAKGANKNVNVMNAIRSFKVAFMVEGDSQHQCYKLLPQERSGQSKHLPDDVRDRGLHEGGVFHGTPRSVAAKALRQLFSGRRARTAKIYDKANSTPGNPVFREYDIEGHGPRISDPDAKVLIRVFEVTKGVRRSRALPMPGGNYYFNDYYGWYETLDRPKEVQVHTASGPKTIVYEKIPRIIKAARAPNGSLKSFEDSCKRSSDAGKKIRFGQIARFTGTTDHKMRLTREGIAHAEAVIDGRADTACQSKALRHPSGLGRRGPPPPY